MGRLDLHRAVLNRDVIHRNGGQPGRLAGMYATGEEMAARGIVLSTDGKFFATGVGGSLEGLWNSDGKTLELFNFPSDPTQPITTPTITLKVSKRGMIYEDTVYSKVTEDP